MTTASTHGPYLSDLERRLADAEETLRAIRSGEVDALVVDGAEGSRIFTLEGADHPYRSLIEAMQQGALSLAEDGTILYCNRGFAGMVGRAHERVIGSGISEFVNHSQRPEIEDLLGRCRTRAGQAEFVLAVVDGRYRPVLVDVAPLPLGDAVTLCMIITDLTEQKRHQETREESRRKDVFMAMLAHELRNPLAPIRNAAAILAHTGVTGERLSYAHDIIERQVSHLSRLVDDLLDVSRITLGKIKLQIERVETATVVARAVETSQPLIDARRQKLTIALQHGGLQLDADPTRLAQVISNLLTNAAKYTDEGGDIHLSAERRGRHVVLRVRDTGMGIPHELQPRIFELFTQGERSLARSEGGLGIGLTLVRKLVEMHGGTAEVNSEGPGKGSEFIVRLPAAMSEVQLYHPDSAKTLPRSPVSHKILVVDDNRDGADSLAMLLRLLGHDVRVAYAGAEALDAVQAFTPSVVLLDIGLPMTDGYAIALELRRRPELAKALVVALTGYGQDEDRQRSREAGFDHHLVKPVDLGALRAILDGHRPSA
jgi:PAS domain S-box-containing protein